MQFKGWKSVKTVNHCQQLDRDIQLMLIETHKVEMLVRVVEGGWPSSRKIEWFEDWQLNVLVKDDSRRAP